MTGFTPDLLIIFASIFLLAALIHGSTGFGFPMVSTPLLALVSDIQTAILLTLIPTFVVNLVTIFSEGEFRQALRQHLTLASLAMLGAGLGTLILIFATTVIFELLLAIAILVYLAANRVRLELKWIRVHPRASKLLFGISAGLLGGLTNVMAPVLIIYGMESGYGKRELIQASNMCFLLGKVIQLSLFTWYGRFSVNELSTSMIMILFVAIALAIGVWIRRKIHVELYMRILRGFLFLLALSLIVKVVV